MGKRYFISYSRKDKDFVDKLYVSLKQKGIAVWLDTKEIHPGENWPDAIQRGLDECQAMILVISPDSMSSRHVSEEWQYYLNSVNQPIYPILIKSTPRHFQLGVKQYVNFLHRSYEEASKELLSVLENADDKLVEPSEGSNPVYSRRGLILAAIIVVILFFLVLFLISNGKPAETPIPTGTPISTLTNSPTPTETPPCDLACINATQDQININHTANAQQTQTQSFFETQTTESNQETAPCDLACINATETPRRATQTAEAGQTAASR